MAAVIRDHVQAKPTIAVLMTCFNRREKTLNCLGALFANIGSDGYALNVFLVDDGSTDGTAVAVKEKYPMVNIITGDGQLFWNRGMCIAFDRALKIGFDGYLWLNDDTILKPDAIQNLLKSSSSSRSFDAIVVGAVCDPVTGEFTYGGSKHIGGTFRPFLCEYVIPNGKLQYLDVFNGNVVFIPDSAAKVVGNLDPLFEHAMGDTDYAMRARKSGVKVLLTGDYVGYCTRNSIIGTHQDKSLPFSLRVKGLFSRKGLPIRSWFVMCWRYGGVLWPIHFFWAYFKLILGRI